MQCTEDNLAVYNEYVVYRLGSDDYKLIVNEKFDLAIVDEAHYISNKDSQRSKLLTDILETIPKIWLLTGTPMTSRPINYFNFKSLYIRSTSMMPVKEFYYINKYR